MNILIKPRARQNKENYKLTRLNKPNNEIIPYSKTTGLKITDLTSELD